MELRRYLTIIRSRTWLIVITTLLAGLAGYVAASAPSTYVARSTIYVGSTSVSFAPSSGDISNDRFTALDRIVLTYSKMIDSDPIARKAIRDLGLDISADDVVQQTEAVPEAGTQLLTVDVSDEDPAMAQTLANGLADTFVKAVQEFEPGDTEGSVPRLPAYVFERAQRPTEPIPTNQLKSTLLAALFGFLAAVGVAFLLDYLDLSIRSAADIERLLELRVLGSVPLRSSSSSSASEANRLIRTGRS